MTRADEMELAWWRSVFSCRFKHENLPMPGVPLYGMRLRIVDAYSDREIDQYGRLK